MESNTAGAFVLEVSELGNEVVKAFTKFITNGKVHDRRFESMYATLTITVSLLRELGSTMSKYENEVPIKDDITRPTCEICKTDLEKLLKLLKEAIQNGNWLTAGNLGGKSVSAAVDPWYLFTVALGGQDAAQEFSRKLNETRRGLLQLNDAIKYTIFKKLNQESRLNPEQVQEFESLTAILPQLVRSLEKSDKAKKDRLNEERTVKSSRHRPDVGQVMIPDQGAKDSDSSSEITLTEVRKEWKPKGVRFEREDDRDSLWSVDSLGHGKVHFDDNDEVYEEWSLRWSEPEKEVRRTMGIFGIKFKERHEEDGFWYVDPELRSQEELKEQHEIATAGMSSSMHRATMERAIQAIPENGGYHVDRLIEDREDATSNWEVKRKWTVVAVSAKKKNPYSSSKKWGKSPKETDWYVTIMGETVDKVKRIRPDRRLDPWFKPRPRARSPVRYIDERRHSGFVPQPPMIVDDYPRVPTTPAGRFSGPLVVGQVPSHEDALKKMDELGQEITA